MNEDRMIEVLAHVARSHASVGAGEVGHNQVDWVRVTECGTTACLAGWTTLLDGWTPILHEVNPRVPHRMPFQVALHCQKDGRIRDIEYLATEILDLTSDQRAEFFYEMGDLEDLYTVVSGEMGVAREVLVDKVEAQARELGPLVWSPA